LQIKPQEIKLAEQLIETLSEDFDPAKYHDTFQERLHALVESKQNGKPFTERTAPRQAQVIDMMDALKKSLRETVRTGKRPRIAGAHAAARNAERLAS
jgi:DNA end-binding protein Ku